MEHCDRCGGFVPAESSACPNCAVATSDRPTGTRRWWKLATTLIVGAGTAITLSACYGLPPQPIDGGNDSGNTTDTGHPTDAATDTGVSD